ncbi:MAG: hypothetical protein K2I34_03615 [Paramuribaculum sp.]|nr:hypothetical protein [Paramuribaculum sp.]
MTNISIYDQVVNFNENEESEVVLTIPYLQEEFRNWLITTRDIKEKSADDYLRAYESAYEPLYDIVGLDLYSLLRSFLKEIPQNTGNDASKEFAPDLVRIYLETLQEELAKNEDTYTQAELRALMKYHDFIVEISGSRADKVSTKPLPDEEEFIAWLEAEYKMDHTNAKRIVSSIKNMDLILPSLVRDPMSFVDVLRAIPDKDKRERYLAIVKQKKSQISAKAACSNKTIQNGMGNIKYYLHFLNSKL